MGPSARDEAVARVVDALRRRTPVLLTGLPGSGTGSLAERAVARLGDDGWQVVRVRGRAGLTGRPRAALTMSGLVRAGPGVPSGDDVAQVLEGTGRAPTVLLVARADLLDDESSAVLAAAADQARVRPLLTSLPARARRLAALRVAGGSVAACWAVPPLRFDEMQVLVDDELEGRTNLDVVGRVYALSGGLPGVARAVVQGARRAGRLVPADGTWAAVGELRTSELTGAVDALLADLDPADVDALEVIATLGPATPRVLRRVVPASALVRLEDAGVLAVLDLAERTEVVVVPPLLAEHLAGAGAHGRLVRAQPHVEDALGLPGVEGVVASPAPGLVPPESPAVRDDAAVLGRLLRRAAATRLAVRRSEWLDEPSPATALAWLDALLQAQASRDDVEAALAEVAARLDEPRHAGLAAWRAVYRALVVHDLPGAIAILEAAGDDATGVLAATRARIDLFGGAAVPADADGTTGLDPALGPGPDAAASSATVPAVRYAAGCRLLAAGRTGEAVRALDGPAPVPDPLRVDPRDVRTVALLLDGRVDEAERHGRQVLAEARAALDAPAVASAAHAVALCLALAARSAALREHLWAALAVGVASPLHPHARAGLLVVASTLASNDGRAGPARALAAEAAEMALPLSPVPLASPRVAELRLAVAGHGDLRAAAGRAWQEVTALLERRFVVAAVLAGTAAAEAECDPVRAHAVAAAAARADGVVLPVLGRYVAAIASERPEPLAEVAPELRAAGLQAHAVRAHARAAHLLTLRGETAAGDKQLARAEEVVAVAGGDLDRLLSVVGPATALSAREVEVARLVAAGASNREAAGELGVSVRTVDNHLYRIYRKLGVADRDGLARRLR